MEDQLAVALGNNRLFCRVIPQGEANPSETDELFVANSRCCGRKFMEMQRPTVDVKTLAEE